MPLPGETNNFNKKKGEYAPAENDDFETTAYKPVPLRFNQADATTIRNREAERAHLTNHTPSFEESRFFGCFRKKKYCVLFFIGSLILFFCLILPLAITYGSGQEEAEDLEDTIAISGHLSISLFSNDTSNATFQEFINEDESSSTKTRRKRGADLTARELNFQDWLTSKLKAALDIYSALCSVSECQDVKLSEFQLVKNRIVTSFSVDIQKDDSNGIFDQSIIDDFVPAISSQLKSDFKDTYPNFPVLALDLDVNFTSLCASPLFNCSFETNMTESMSLQSDNRSTSSNDLFEEADWRSSKDRKLVLLNTSFFFANASTEQPSTSTSSSWMTTFTWLLSTITTSTTLQPPTTSTLLTTVRPKPTTVFIQKAAESISCANQGFTCLFQAEKIPEYQRCDGIMQCRDGSDEKNCQACRTGFSCVVGNEKMCLRGSRICDGHIHCPDGSDESSPYCKAICKPESEYRCRGVNKCIPLNFLCDGDNHCPSGDDELVCVGSKSCNNDAKWCEVDRRCIPLWSWCDGHVDCTDGSDESFCMCNINSNNSTFK